ncbi:MAG: hypothetical protein UX60_C0017G0003 [Berkelbacteria bacterium GW2011_GWA2_46_7]|uniref:Uncharacterized protein n=1 Tax=Berkelbacteria bacterium GW2011_GWA2_46_7 TaxID=1618335 RepID=A0A0G1QFN3_9BACT|nr:MAG: hypothetical protein UX60_C0017G0003 [Berkelbacteria bacterium GW2011_GWA2_46_7]
MSRAIALFVIWALSLPGTSASHEQSHRSVKKATLSKPKAKRTHRAFKRKPRLQFTVLRFSRERDLWLPQIFSGLTAAQVKTKTKADYVFTLGFLDIRKVRGARMYRPINLHIIEGTIKIPAFFPEEKVIADFPLPWEGVTIFDSVAICLSYGTPVAACGLMRIPPVPGEKTGRRIWATKGGYFFVVSYFGTRTDGLRIAKNYGFESSAHSDGGHMISSHARGASFALIFKGKRQLATAGLFNPIANFSAVGAW